MRRHGKWLLVGALLVGLASTGTYFWLGGDDFSARLLYGERTDDTSPETLQLTGAPMFPFGNVYLDGRSHWFRNRFQADRDALITQAVPPELIATPKVHREAFTSGPWLDALDELLRAEREQTEGQAVETIVYFHVPGVDPDRLVLFLACSGFRQKMEGADRFEQERFFPPLTSPPDGFERLPPLGARQVLARERWRGQLAKPTDVYLLSEVERWRDDAFALVYEAWKNVGDETHAEIKLASGQYAVVAKDGGSLVGLRSFYSGQTVPRLMDAFVVGMTRAFYAKLGQHIRETAAAWEPDAAARAWIETLRW